MDKVYTIDNGNNQCHVGLFSDGKLLEIHNYRDFQFPKDKTPIIYSSVGKKNSLPGLDARKFFADGHFFSMPVHYTQTLGTDRLVLGRYFYHAKQTPPTFIIDAGSFITVDLVTDQGFMGGIILPGLDIYLKNFSQAANLPILSKEKLLATSMAPLKAHSTEEAIMGGLRLILEKVIMEEIVKRNIHNIYWTGGDGNMLHTLFGKGSFIPHLIHLGLNKVYTMLK